MSMASESPLRPALLKGALVEFSERFIGPVPNIIVFQYNPQSLTRSLEVWTPPEKAAGPKAPGAPAAAPTSAQPSDPPESFSLALELDATDDLEVGDPIAVATGVADRVAALEMLLYPQEGSLVGDLLGAVGVSVSISVGGVSVGATAAEPVPRGEVPVVLLVWGPGRIVPVRLTSFQVEEQMFSPTLYPVHARVTVGLKVQTEADLKSYKDSVGKELAIAAYKFTRKQKQVLAAANMANSVESILGMLPF